MGGTAAFFLALFIIPGRFGIRWNASPSLPVGIYIETADPEYKEPGHDRYTRGLTAKDLRRIGKAMETVHEELGPDLDFGIEAHWRYDVRDAINMAKVIEPVKPMWLEDPVPPGNPESMAYVTRNVNVPISTGENLYTRDGFRRLIELQGAIMSTSTFLRLARELALLQCPLRKSPLQNTEINSEVGRSPGVEAHSRLGR